MSNVIIVIKGIASVLAGAGALIFFKRIFWRKAPAVCKNANKLDGKTVIVTGANTGIGKEVAKELAKRNARVIMACRNVEKGEKAASDIKRELLGHGELVVVKLDLASLRSVREFCDKINNSEKSLDILINNAGVFGPPFIPTEDGYETTFAVNHLGHFLLTNLLLEKLKESAPARIIIVASKLYEKVKINFQNLNGEEGYSKANAYAQSKLANMLFSLELHKRLPKGVTVNTMHPGMVATELPRHMLNNIFKRFLFPLFAFLFMRSPLQGAQTVIHLATSNEVTGISGKYFGDCEEEKIKENALDKEIASKLWELSIKLSGLN